MTFIERCWCLRLLRILVVIIAFILQELKIREFSFSGTNANFVWPHNEATLAALLNYKVTEDFELSRNVLIVELGSGTGILTIALRKMGFTSAISSDYDNSDIADNISHNCNLNGIYEAHIPHNWGQEFPWSQLKDVVPGRCFTEIRGQPSIVLVASDILLYRKLYSDLVRTIRQLLSPPFGSTQFCLKPFMILGAKRRVTGDDEFFAQLRNENCEVTHLGGRMFFIAQN